MPAVFLLKSRKLFYFLLAICSLSTLILLFALRELKKPEPKEYGIEWVYQMQFRNNVEFLDLNEVRNYTMIPEGCNETNQYNEQEDILALIVVTSYVGNQENRQHYRNSISPHKLRDLGMKRVFVVGSIEAGDLITQQQIDTEQLHNGDLLQGTFVDIYRNNYKKTIMGLDWAARHCPQAKFVVKMDDDVVHNLYRLYDILQYYDVVYPVRVNSTQLLIGTERHDSPIRNKTKKRYVSEEDYKPPHYPAHLLGCLYVTNPKTAEALVQQTEYVPVFWLDDVWITGILREYLGFPLMAFQPYTEAHGTSLTDCMHEFRVYQLKCPYLYHRGADDVAKYLGEFQSYGEICYYGNNQRLCNERTFYQKLRVWFWDLVDIFTDCNNDAAPTLNEDPKCSMSQA